MPDCLHPQIPDFQIVASPKYYHILTNNTSLESLFIINRMTGFVVQGHIHSPWQANNNRRCSIYCSCAYMLLYCGWYTLHWPIRRQNQHYVLYTEHFNKTFNYSSTKTASSCSYLDHVRFVPHSADFWHVPHLLLHQRCFKRHKHEERKDAVVPVLIQTPQTHTKHLQGDRNIQFIPYSQAGVSQSWIQDVYSKPFQW